MPILVTARFPLAVAVVVAHFASMRGQGQAPALLVDVVRQAGAAVSLFFCLSGYVLVLRYAADISSRTFRWRAYGASRVARIMPVYLLALAVSAAVDLPREFAHGHGWATALLTPLMLQAWLPGTAEAWNGPGWSMSVEAVCYLLFPLALMLVARRPAWGWAIVAVAASGAVVTSLPGVLPAGGYLNNPLSQLTPFALGMWCATHQLAYNQWPVVWRRLLVTFAVLGDVLSIQIQMPQGLARLLLATGSAALLLACSGRLVQTCGSRVAQTLGLSSYALYLLHVPLAEHYLPYMRTYAVPAPVALAGFVVLSVAVALVVHVTFEQPVRRWVIPLLAPRRVTPVPAMPPPRVPAQPAPPGAARTRVPVG